jgi:hypothetical protein
MVKYRRFLSNDYGGLAATLRTLGRPTEAAEFACERRDLWPGEPAELFLAARDLGLCAPLAAAGSDERRRFADLAMRALRQAAAAGYRDAARLRDDPDLAPLQSRDDFPPLVQDAGFPADPFAPAAR